MAIVVKLTFNPFQENTYIVYDESGECVIFDPGCYESFEKQELTNTIERLRLRPVRLVNTHCHIDHILGNLFVSQAYQLPLEIHEGEMPVLAAAEQTAKYFGMPYPEPSPQPGRYIADGELIEFGQTQLKAILTPGHSPASLSFFCDKDRFLIAGDVLFEDGIGRTDLPGGNYQTLIASIQQKLFPLGDEVRVYPGHGASTTIGQERKTNPFVGENAKN